MKTILITGASRGIGKATAERFLANGDFVIGTSTKGTADWSHPNLVVFQLDLSKPESIKECVEKISKLDKKVDILINNAGINVEEWEETVLDVEKLRETLEVNLFGLVGFTEEVLKIPHSLKHIINISSRAGSLSDDNDSFMPAYRISKTAINMYTRTLSTRLASSGITVSSLDPDWVKTDMGGFDAPGEAKDAGESIFNLANSEVETGQFWLNGKKRSW